MTASFADSAFPEPSEAALRAIHLGRLGHLLRLRHQYERDLNYRGLRLLDRSIFAAYCDCRDAGAEARAQDLLRAAHVAVERPAKVQLSFLDATTERPRPASHRSTPTAQPKG
jgi:hypothetical protein